MKKFIRMAAECGYHQVNKLSFSNINDIVLAAETASYIAKATGNDDFYRFKIALSIQAVQLGAKVGWKGYDKHGRILMLSAPETGTVTIHIKDETPFNDLDIPAWEYPWHGVYRQPWSLESITSPVYRKRMAIATQPGAEWDEQPSFAAGNAADFQVKLKVH